MKLSVLAAAVLLLPTSAWACGGLFCSTLPVVQESERILFEVPGDGTITVTVDIKYRGSSDDFSWILPVSDTPDLGVSDAETLRAIDAATMPEIIPPEALCSHPVSNPMANCGDCDGEADAGGGGLPGDQSVTVEDLPQVGPYDPVVVSSDDPGAIKDWLEENGYLVTRAMDPLIAEYTLSGMKFLALKLAPDASVGAISPIRITYPGDKPSVPLRLTAVGARADMLVAVFIASNQRYARRRRRHVQRGLCRHVVRQRFLCLDQRGGRVRL